MKLLLASFLFSACLASPSPASRPPFNVSSWLGSGYYAPTPSPDNLGWWSFYSLYRPHVVRELPLIRRTLGFNTLRVFLHTLAYEASPAAFLRNVEDFLALASAANLRVGLVFFGSGPQGNASTTRLCEPRKGLSNGCWKASPQLIDETSVARYEPYVTALVSEHATDPRVAFWELQNEPSINNTWWEGLRDAAFGWARAQNPDAPIISCWLDNPDTQLVDVHVYSTDFSSVWMPRIFTNASKGALITEGGGRWTEPPTVAAPGDFGAPLAALNFLRALRLRAANGTAPFMPGVLLGWEVLIGNSNSRWYWAAKEGTPEPHVPWLGFLWPDGTPVSFTEAAALREYGGGKPEFLAFDKWLLPTEIKDGDAWLTLPPGGAHWARGAVAAADALVEAAVWLEAGGTGCVTVRAAASSGGVDGYRACVAVAARELWVERVHGGAVSPLGKRFDLSLRENGLCVGCFNLLRMEVAAVAGGGATVKVWLNVMFADCGFKGDPVGDASRVPHAPAPLLAVEDGAPGLAAGGVVVSAAGAPLRVDYIAALPLQSAAE